MPFRDVVGHVRLIDLLSRSVAGSTVPPSLLFAGPAGVGKHLTALAVAQALNCTKGSEFKVQGSTFAVQGSGFGVRGSGVDACGTCAACRRIARGVHPDVLLVGPGDSGYRAAVGVRSRLSDKVEGRVAINYTDVGDYGNGIGADAGLVVHLNDTWGLFGSYDYSDRDSSSLNTWNLGVRASF